MSYLMVADKADVVMLDDQPENLHLLTNLLANDFRVHPFSDAAKFMAYIEQGKPADLILLDVVMPDMDGGDVAAAIQQDPLLKRIPVIFVTAVVRKREAGSAGMVSGGSLFLAKPIDIVELIDAIETSLGKPSA